MSILSKSLSPFLIRGAGVVANAAAPSTLVKVHRTLSQRLSVFVDFTLGSLDSATFTPQLSFDGANWYDVTSPGALQLTATGKKTFVVDCTGAKLFRVVTSSAGTPTDSNAVIHAGWQIDD